MYVQICFPFFLNKTFTYYAPNSINDKSLIGYLVSVNFNNKVCTGLIVSCSKTATFKGTTHSILSFGIQIPFELWETLNWMNNYYVTPIGKIAQIALSWGFKKQIAQPKKFKVISLNQDKHTLDDYKNQLSDLTVNQKNLIKFLLKQYPNSISLVDLKDQFSSIYSIAKQLKDKNLIIDSFEKEKNINILPTKSVNSIKLTTIQNNVYKNILSNEEKRFKPHFIYGVTGSGKTEIYLKLTQTIFCEKKSCLILAPEIVISSQLYNRFKSYFGDKVLLWHSQISNSYKRTAWTKINSGEPYIIIGARSALFTPLKNLGLIIVDEEHDSSYKESDRQPCYNARDIAIVRAKFSNSIIILGSATPSLETYYNAIKNKYYLYKINERYGQAVLPQVELINMNNVTSATDQSILSDHLINKIRERLNKKEQVLILHNRRGFSSLKVCNKSNDLLKCKDCDVILTVHQSTNQLICHYCSSSYNIESLYKKYTKDDIIYLGYGTEKIEGILNNLFPDASVLRIDTDTANSLNKQNKVLNLFKSGKCDILLGTQMIAKGLDFDNVTLVAVINADLGTIIPDFKANENLFQLINQVIGRSGRRNKKGLAIIQTHKPNNKTLKMATSYQSKHFYNLQLNNRKALNYPPFSRLIRIIFSGSNYKSCYFNAEKVFKYLSKDFSEFLIGPFPCPIEKLFKKSRYHILIKCPHPQLKNVLNRILIIQNKKQFLNSKKVNMLIDVDPISIL